MSYLVHADKDVIEAMSNLQGNTNFAKVMEWIAASENAVVGHLANSTSENLYRAQGAYGVLNDLHSVAKDARNLLAKLSSRSS